MPLSKDEAIEIAHGFLNLIRPKHSVRQAFLFGSFAKDMAKDYSDVDLALVLESLGTNQDSPFGEEFEIFHEAQEYNSLLEVVCFAKDRFDQNNGTLIRRVKKEGIRLV